MTTALTDTAASVYDALVIAPATAWQIVDRTGLPILHVTSQLTRLANIGAIKHDDHAVAMRWAVSP